MATALPKQGRTMRATALFCATAFALLVGPAAAQQQTAQQVAAALQAKYDSVRDFSADFTQEFESVLKRKITERGKLQVKKPGKMRWDYTDPEKKLFVSDGIKMYLWQPADNQVTRSSVPKQDEATTAVLFLVGKGNLTRDFTVSFAPDAPAGTYALRLDPKLPERDYEWLNLVVDQKTLQIRALTAPDRQGGRSRFLFSNFKENKGIPDSTFVFKIPKGADVIDADSSSR
jgi:outer membrane lipoprotein carrier protein